jgi:hypothetical protein
MPGGCAASSSGGEDPGSVMSGQAESEQPPGVESGDAGMQPGLFLLMPR